jgi:signal transduction histidine kinase
VRRRLEDDLRQAQKMEAVGRLAGGIAHDFNNLLTAISGYAEMIEESPTRADIAADAHQIRRAAGRAAELTQQLLAFGGKQVLRPQHVDLTSVVQSVQPLLSSLVGTHVRLELDLAPSSLVEVDPAQIEQVLVNLTLNARDSMVSGGVLIIRTVRETDAVVRLEVVDTGEGMSDESLARALEPFYTTKPLGEGTGLGLPTVLGIVEQSGGTFSLTSRPGEGTCASIVFPMVEAQLAA